tara:strand:+ start:1233 stop:1859 length:627 start_codon:yes stop_codon:yes gene_type:complete
MRFLCLSNSWKEKGRCLAGLKMGPDNKIYKSSWIRPVYRTEHEQIPSKFASEFKHFDIIKFDVDNDYSRNDYQSENIMVKDDSLIKVGTTENAFSSYIVKICENSRYNNIFGNSEKSIDDKDIHKLDYSLMLLSVNNFAITKGYNLQKRLVFHFKGSNYDFPITDPFFQKAHTKDESILDNVAEIYILISLGVSFNSKCYKLIASILY